MASFEHPGRIEPAFLEEAIPSDITDIIAELSAAAESLGRALHPETARGLADTVRIMNTYYSNLIEGHETRPRDIERALKGEFDSDRTRRNLQMEATALLATQARIDVAAAGGELPEPASRDWIRGLHREFYQDAPEEMLLIKGRSHEFRMVPGEWRSKPEHDVEVGDHVPPSSAHVADFMAHFERRFATSKGRGTRLMQFAGAHHRFNYIHPFPDGNGRVSRLMSHAMAHKAEIGAHGLWSISRGLARGLESRGEYKRMMAHADTTRQGDRDGRGSLSQSALAEFTAWFLKICLDQVQFMAGLFDLDQLAKRLRRYTAEHDGWKPEAGDLLEDALRRGSFERGEIGRITRLPERTARRVLKELTEDGMLASATEKGPVSLRFPSHSLEVLFPRLYPQT